MFKKMHDEFFKLMPDEPKKSHSAVLHLNLIYVVYVGTDLLRRYDEREDDIVKMMARDEAKDEQVASARLASEPSCQHCGKFGLRITDKMLMNRDRSDRDEEILFMLRCTHCNKNSNYWEDGTAWEHLHIACPKCKAVMNEKDVRKGKVITTTYNCLTCGHSYEDKLDLTPKKEKLDPEFETDRAVYCLQDEKNRQELRDAKWRCDEMARLGKEMKEREDNKHIYNAMNELKKPKIAELVPLLAPVLEKAGYIEFGLDKPEIGKDVFIGFSCLDSKSDREDYDSRKTLQRLVRTTLEDTNWRIMSDGISFRLGYLSGRLRAYEREDDMRELVMKNKKLVDKHQKDSKPDDKMTVPTIKGKDGEDIIL